MVARQVRSLEHRGPDASGIHCGTMATIGQTRLAVIDLVSGDPPVTNEDGTVGVALNGEIYNFLELREQLISAGHSFKTTGDTEVLAHLAEDLEPVEMARMLNGMYALAVADDRRGRLFLARDPLGKKPLYYHYSAAARRLVFGSELKAVLAHPGVPRTIHPEAIPAYLSLGHMPSPHTFYSGIQSVPPGSVLIIDGSAGPRIEQWWSPPIAGVDAPAHRRLSLPEAVPLVRRWLSEAVEHRLVADVPIGAFLSGGVDSSAVVALMALALDRPVRTFTIGFEDDEGFDERRYARLVADRWNTDHVEQVVHPNAVDLVERLVHHYDEPFGDSSAIPTFLLSELTRQHVTVALSGDGGDEVFGGYERFSMVPALHRLRPLAPLLRPLVSRGPSLAHQPGRARTRALRRMVERISLDLPEAWGSWLQLLPHQTVFALTGRMPTWAIADLEHVWSRSEGGVLLDRLLHLNMRTYLLNDLLPKADRMSMAHGLEVRSPFLDRELVQRMATLPPALKATTVQRKRVLRAAMADLLPDEVLSRRKHGFGVPLDRWFRADLHRFFESRVLVPGALVAEHLQPAGVRALWLEHQNGHSHGHLLWALLTLEVFLQSQ